MADLESRLRDPAPHAGPSEEATARARAALAGVRPRRTSLGADALLPGGRRRMAARVLTLVAVLAVAAAAVATVVTAGPAPPPAAPVPTLPTEVRRCDRPADEAAITCVEGAAERRLGTPELRDAPWLTLGPGDRQWSMATAPPRPSLEFPPGVTYAQALSRLYVWATVTGTLPPEATVGPPLPDGVVLLRPDDPARGIAIDLRAPWGWEPSMGGVILGPNLTSPPGIPAQARPGELWARGQRVGVPSLPDCEVIRGRDETPPPCTGGPVFGASPAPELPVIRTDEPAPAGPELAYADGPRCTFRAGRDGVGRAVVVEADYVNQGLAGRGRFTGAVELAGSGRTVQRTVARDVAAEEELTVRIVVPLAPGDRVHLFGGRPECSVDAAP